MERNLVTLEQQIYALETSYLEDTHSRGNKKPHFSNKHRVFSLSSTTALQANGLGSSAAAAKLDRDDEDSDRDDDNVEDEDDDEEASNDGRSEEETTTAREKKVVRRRRTDSYKLE